MSLLKRDEAVLVVVDVQEGFRSYGSFLAVAAACSKLIPAGLGASAFVRSPKLSSGALSRSAR